MPTASRAFRAVGTAVDGAPMLTVVTYNILADKFATGGFHSYCPASLLEWTHRAPRLVSELLGYRADLVCLQEVERPFFEADFEPQLQQQGYEALYYGRQRKPTDPVAGPEEGVCLAYRTDRLQRLASRVVRLGDLVPELSGAMHSVDSMAFAQGGKGGSSSRSSSSSGGGGKDSKFWRFVAEREDGAVLALLRDRQAERVLLAACTHLYWDPKWPDVKVVQAALLCRAVKAFLVQQGAASRHWGGQGMDSVPAIIAGDFNSLAEKHESDAFDTVPAGGVVVSGTYHLLTTGRLDPSHHDHPAVRRGALPSLQKLALDTSGVALSSACKDAWGHEPAFTNHTATFTGCLDYIFHSPRHFEVAGALEMPFSGEGGEGGGAGGEGPPPMPNETWPSDHLAVGAQLRWK